MTHGPLSVVVVVRPNNGDLKKWFPYYRGILCLQLCFLCNLDLLSGDEIFA